MLAWANEYMDSIKIVASPLLQRSNYCIISTQRWFVQIKLLSLALSLTNFADQSFLQKAIRINSPFGCFKGDRGLYILFRNISSLRENVHIAEEEKMATINNKLHHPVEHECSHCRTSFAQRYHLLRHYEKVSSELECQLW